MKLNYKRTFLIGFAFFGILLLWQVYDSWCPTFLTDIFARRFYGMSSADLKASDVKSAKAIVSADGKYTDYIIYVKDQTDGPNGDSHNGGPVACGVGTLGSIDEALNQLGAEFKSGKENVKLTYTNAYIFARVDNSTGKIINGTYHYLVKINISEAELKLGISAKVKNMYGEVDYFVRIGNNKQGYNGAKG